ncbi:hypothetical protein Anas_01350 [Armadillidium nasatum]|uniref:Uncharacterized protein n=1 Tax=Armadillidium nasatum TaxID=96803 RepID=A0A5N5TKX5_9CRUS|nr:hypothetical protein Anas_01350 [Armadillidium nasatum]
MQYKARAVVYIQSIGHKASPEKQAPYQSTCCEKKEDNYFKNIGPIVFEEESLLRDFSNMMKSIISSSVNRTISENYVKARNDPLDRIMQMNWVDNKNNVPEIKGGTHSSSNIKKKSINSNLSKEEFDGPFLNNSDLGDILDKRTCAKRIRQFITTPFTDVLTCISDHRLNM